MASESPLRSEVLIPEQPKKSNEAFQGKHPRLFDFIQSLPSFHTFSLEKKKSFVEYAMQEEGVASGIVDMLLVRIARRAMSSRESVQQELIDYAQELLSQQENGITVLVPVFWKNIREVMGIEENSQRDVDNDDDTDEDDRV